MSTLTKILIVLLALSSIFLSGIVVTYVGTANNYKKEFQARKASIDSLNTDNEYKTDQINSLNEQLKSETAKHGSIVDALQSENDGYKTEIENLKNQLSIAQTKVENANAELISNSKTVAENNQLRKAAEEKLANLEALKISNENKINELTDKIVTKDAIIDRLESDKKLLVEEKTKIQNELDKYLQLASQRSFTSYPGTVSSGSVITGPIVKNIDIEGVITEIKPQDSLASISKGSAQGVKIK